MQRGIFNSPERWKWFGESPPSRFFYSDFMPNQYIFKIKRKESVKNAIKTLQYINEKKRDLQADKREACQFKEIAFKSIFVFFFHKSLRIAIAVFTKFISEGFFINCLIFIKTSSEAYKMEL